MLSKGSKTGVQKTEVKSSNHYTNLFNNLEDSNQSPLNISGKLIVEEIEHKPKKPNGNKFNGSIGIKAMDDVQSPPTNIYMTSEGIHESDQANDEDAGEGNTYHKNILGTQ